MRATLGECIDLTLLCLILSIFEESWQPRRCKKPTFLGGEKLRKQRLGGLLVKMRSVLPFLNVEVVFVRAAGSVKLIGTLKLTQGLWERSQVLFSCPSFLFSDFTCLIPLVGLSYSIPSLLTSLKL